MNPRVKEVFPLENYLLQLVFTKEGIFDVKPWLDKGVFKELKDTELFKNAHLILGTVSWNNEIDFSPDTLSLDSKKLIAK